MQWRKGAKKGAKKGGKKGAPARGFTIALFGSLFRALLFPFPAELQVGPHFCWSSTLFVLLIEKGKKNRTKNKENGKKGEKGSEKGSEKGLL
jgi:hypothetical protein